MMSVVRLVCTCVALLTACDHGLGTADQRAAAPHDPANRGPDAGARVSENVSKAPDTHGPPGAAVASEADLDALAAGVSWTEPGAVAVEALNRCKGTNPLALLAVSTRVNREAGIAVRDGQTVCGAVFGADSWRNLAVAAWDGRVRSVRVRGDEARASFHDLADDEFAVVSMKRQDGQWRFDDIDSPARASFETWGAPVD
jgi:hypothetical protein